MRQLSFVVAALALCAPMAIAGSARAQDATAKEEAVRHFRAGVAHLQDPEGPRYEDAYAEFKRAYDVSRSPKVLGNLGLCAMKLERDGEAINAYQRYLSEVNDIDPEERAQVARDLDVLVTSAISLTLTTHGSQATIVDTRLPTHGTSLTNFYDVAPGTTTIKVRPGHHVTLLRIDGKDRARWEWTAASGEKISHDFVASEAPPPVPEPPKSSPSALRFAPIAVTGLGGALLLSGAIVGGIALSKVHSLESQCPMNACPASVYPDNVNGARPFVQATDYLLLTGGIVAVGGGVWWLVSSLRGPSAQTSAMISGACTGAGCFASVRGAF